MQVSEQRDLAFGTFVDKATKAPETTLEQNGKEFKVWGYYVAGTDGNWAEPTAIWADGQTVKREAGVWVYSPVKQWIPNKQYRFYALAPTTISATCTSGASKTESGKITVADFIVNPTISAQTDLMVATRYDRNTNAMDNSAINLTFKHVLSKVTVQFNSSSKYNIQLTEVTLGNIAGKATGVMTPALMAAGATVDANWTLDEEAEAISFPGVTTTDPLPAVDSKFPFVSHQSMLMIPQEFTTKKPLNLNVKYTVDGKGDATTGEDYFEKSLEIVGTWTAGHSITYIITIKTGDGDGSGLDIVFGKTEIDEWVTDTAIPGNVQ
ncbi:MAG: fimbrillin family protein [Bacteroidales bacterium]